MTLLVGLLSVPGCSLLLPISREAVLCSDTLPSAGSWVFLASNRQGLGSRLAQSSAGYSSMRHRKFKTTLHQFNPKTHLDLQLKEKDASLLLNEKQHLRMMIKESSRRKIVVEGEMMVFLHLCSGCGQHRVKEITNKAP